MTRLDSGEAGTFGVLSVGVLGSDGAVVSWQPRWVTLEPPWRDNHRWDGVLEHVSCIPEGEYKCVEVKSPKFGRTYEVMDVPGRSDILFHAFNKVDETHGCIGVGLSYATRVSVMHPSKEVKRERVIANSKAAVQALLDWLSWSQDVRLVVDSALRGA